MVRPYVEGFYDNAQDYHPIGTLGVNKAEKQEFLDRQEWIE
jgi:hypothetical protein